MTVTTNTIGPREPVRIHTPHQLMTGPTTADDIYTMDKIIFVTKIIA